MAEPGRLRRLAAGLDLRTGVVYVYAAIAVLVIQYAAIRPVFIAGEGPLGADRLLPWSLTCFLLWFVGPALIVKLGFRERLSDFGLTFRGMGRHLWIYAVMFLLMVPVIWVVSTFPDFQRTYPFADTARNGPEAFLTWELIYGLQFLSLEFFFRGFLIFGPEKRLGPNTVFVMLVPYCMLHFYKPGLEATASIGAGLILGLLAYRTRCVLGGVLIHWAVAASMDLLAILQTGGFR